MEKIFTSFLLLLHYVTVSSAMTQTRTTTDKLSLISLKSQIISYPFQFLYESWSPATSVCHWVGVTCGSRYQRVKSLNLPNMTLTGRIPQVFGNLSFLVSLDLGSKKWHACVGQIPKVIGNFRELKLRGNNLIGSVPLSLSNASRLETSNIYSNSLQGNISEGIGNLQNMKMLGIQDNQLAVEDNQITGSVLISLFNISLVQILSLERFLPPEIGNLTNTQRLQINGNRLIGEIPKEINNLIELEKLDLEANSYSGSLDMEILNISGAENNFSFRQQYIRKPSTKHWFYLTQH
ncbi:hypothetical protein P3S68_003298 [Capsicum galapagoense]